LVTLYGNWEKGQLERGTTESPSPDSSPVEGEAKEKIKLILKKRIDQTSLAPCGREFKERGIQVHLPFIHGLYG
jgi:hypothetical protein